MGNLLANEGPTLAEGETCARRGKPSLVEGEIDARRGKLTLADGETDARREKLLLADALTYSRMASFPGPRVHIALREKYSV
jgi:hypothetical protein